MGVNGILGCVYTLKRLKKKTAISKTVRDPE